MSSSNNNENPAETEEEKGWSSKWNKALEDEEFAEMKTEDWMIDSFMSWWFCKRLCFRCAVLGDADNSVSPRIHSWQNGTHRFHNSVCRGADRESLEDAKMSLRLLLPMFMLVVSYFFLERSLIAGTLSFGWAIFLIVTTAIRIGLYFFFSRWAPNLSAQISAIALPFTCCMGFGWSLWSRDCISMVMASLFCAPHFIWSFRVIVVNQISVLLYFLSALFFSKEPIPGLRPQLISAFVLATVVSLVSSGVIHRERVLLGVPRKRSVVRQFMQAVLGCYECVVHLKKDEIKGLIVKKIQRQEGSKLPLLLHLKEGCVLSPSFFGGASKSGETVGPNNLKVLLSVFSKDVEGHSISAIGKAAELEVGELRMEAYVMSNGRDRLLALRCPLKKTK